MGEVFLFFYPISRRETMQKLLIAVMTAVAVVVLPTYLAAKEGKKPQRPRPEGRRMAPNPRVMFQRLDANKDKVIVADELPVDMPKRFKLLLIRADANKDGKLTPGELSEAIKKRHQARKGKDRPTPPRPVKKAKAGAVKSQIRCAKAIFNRLDKDDDGKLSFREFFAGFRRLHHAMAARAKMLKGKAAMHHPKKKIAKMMKHHPGKKSAKAMKHHPKKMIAKGMKHYPKKKSAKAMKHHPRKKFGDWPKRGPDMFPKGPGVYHCVWHVMMWREPGPRHPGAAHFGMTPWCPMPMKFGMAPRSPHGMKSGTPPGAWQGKFPPRGYRGHGRPHGKQTAHRHWSPDGRKKPWSKTDRKHPWAKKHRGDKPKPRKPAIEKPTGKVNPEQRFSEIESRLTALEQRQEAMLVAIQQQQAAMMAALQRTNELVAAKLASLGSQPATARPSWGKVKVTAERKTKMLARAEDEDRQPRDPRRGDRD